MDEAGADAFRRFALAVYGSDDVPAACLLLQRRFDLDANLLLFAAYVGAARAQPLTGSSLEAARSSIEPWHREVVRPLRGVRQRLKTGPAPAPDSATTELRRKVQELEIEAELIELAELGRLAPDTAPAQGDAAERATAAMNVVLSGSDRAADEPERSALALIAAAAARQIEVE